MRLQGRGNWPRSSSRGAGSSCIDDGAGLDADEKPIRKRKRNGVIEDSSSDDLFSSASDEEEESDGDFIADDDEPTGSLSPQAQQDVDMAVYHSSLLEKR